jgi:hypothetical protein
LPKQNAKKSKNAIAEAQFPPPNQNLPKSEMNSSRVLRIKVGIGIGAVLDQHLDNIETLLLNSVA